MAMTSLVRWATEATASLPSIVTIFRCLCDWDMRPPALGVRVGWFVRGRHSTPEGRGWIPRDDPGAISAGPERTLTGVNVEGGASAPWAAAPSPAGSAGRWAPGV